MRNLLSALLSRRMEFLTFPMPQGVLCGELL